ncbi:serine hydrolase [Enterococcus sp. DIV0212c]|uniref:serine hydrolase n=1 Tax=Enterococcus sp. DIV0212c TaxID=2230867 RepID=UPI001F611593|nr:serine hydrolase [Enterococcus sp. DIV0212c]
MEKKKMSLYGMIFSICFFLIVSFFFSTHTVDYANETETNEKINTPVKTTSTSASKNPEPKVTESPELTAFYHKINQTMIDVAKSFKGDVGMTYVDLTTGKQLSVDGTKEFYSASTIKVPLAMMVADKVQAGSLKWEDQLTFNEKEDYEDGTGIIINNIQPTYSVRTLQEYSITYSDNIAKNMLYDTFGGDVKAKQALYAHFLQKETDWDDAKLTSEDAAKILKILYEEKSSNQEYQTIYDYMKNTVFHERMDTPTTSGKVAHKIGSYEGFLHDIGILETEHPFILTVFTNGQTDAGISFISMVTDQLWSVQSNEYPKK